MNLEITRVRCKRQSNAKDDEKRFSRYRLALGTILVFGSTIPDMILVFGSTIPKKKQNKIETKNVRL